MSVDTYDGVPMQVDSEVKRRARKEHKCDACGETIQRTHFYIRHFVRWEGTTETIKRCMRCQAIYVELSRLHSEARNDTAPAWRLDCGDSFQDVFGREPPPELAALAFALPGELK